MARNSASIEDRGTVACFFAFQEMRDFPKNTQNSVVDLREIGQVA